MTRKEVFATGLLIGSALMSGCATYAIVYLTLAAVIFRSWPLLAFPVVMGFIFFPSSRWVVRYASAIGTGWISKHALLLYAMVAGTTFGAIWLIMLSQL